jgi:hypothetical protein
MRKQERALPVVPVIQRISLVDYLLASQDTFGIHNCRRACAKYGVISYLFAINVACGDRLVQTDR